MRKSFLGPVHKVWWLVPVIVSSMVLAHAALAQEDFQITRWFLFRVAGDMAQCSGAYRVTSEIIGGPEGEVLGNLANGFEHSSGLVASLVTNDREVARQSTDNRVEAYARAWAVRAKRALEGDGVEAYYSKMNGLCDKYGTLNGELVEQSLQFGYAGNNDADAWSSMVTEALVRFMQSPEGVALVREAGE